MIRGMLAATILCLFASTASAAVKVVDGDTIVLDGETVRIRNIDTPEIGSPKCQAELKAGLKAKQRLQAIVKDKTVSLKRGDGSRMTDRYGRTLALVFVDGRDVGEQLVSEGLARRWNGKRRPWCQ